MPEEGQKLLARFKGQVQTIYLDPPFNTGKQFEMKMRVGAKGYRTGSPQVMYRTVLPYWVTLRQHPAGI